MHDEVAALLETHSLSVVFIHVGRHIRTAAAGCGDLTFEAGPTERDDEDLRPVEVIVAAHDQRGDEALVLVDQVGD